MKVLRLTCYFKNYVNIATEYAYNANGAMTQDLNKGITEIRYNSLNLPQQIDIVSPVAEARNEYIYSVAGQKLRLTQRYNPNSSLKRQYAGNKVYENSVLKKILLPNGYFENGNYYFYLRDHLGNNCVVANASGEIQQSSHYYPFGKVNEYESGGQSFQPYKFGGKEDEPMFGLGLYDFEARQLDKVVPRFTTMDPLAEKYYSISPYAYCANNPVRFVDPTGMRKIDPVPGTLPNPQREVNVDEISTQEAQMVAEQEQDKRALSEAVWSSHQPQLYATNYVTRNGSLIISTDDGYPNRFERAAPLDEVTVEAKRKHKPGNGTVATGYSLNVNTAAGGSVGANIVNIVVIEKGPYAGTVIGLSEAHLGGGLILDVSGSIGITKYGYIGDINNLEPNAFTGESSTLNQSFGEGIIFGFGTSTSDPDNFGGILKGRTMTIGVGAGSPINFSKGKIYTEPFNR